ncbi:MAG: type I methionyl aminopeptidase [Myxococcota bacterium]
MRIERLNARQVDSLRRAGRVAAQTLAAVGETLRAGLTTAAIDRFVRTDTAARNAAPSQLGYHGFPGAVCTSRNDVVCHGIPSERDVLEEGDIVSVDVTSHFEGWHGDTCRTFAIGTPTPERAHVLRVAEACCQLGIRTVRDGIRLGDLGAVVDDFAQAEGCAIVRDVGGHGIGRAMHLSPHVSFFGTPGTGRRLRRGMAITIEPIVVLGESAEVTTDPDGWTMRSASGAPAAQFEHTIVVTRDGAEVMTLRGQ